MAHRKNAYYLLSLGCAKNTVDSESMAALLEQAGLRGTEDAERAEVLIVNTCGFIGPAREESINALRELAALKTTGPIPDRGRVPVAALRPRSARAGAAVGRRDRHAALDGHCRSGAAAARPQTPRADLSPAGRSDHGRDGRARREPGRRAGRERLPQDRGWLPPPVRLLRDPGHQGDRRQPPDGSHSGRSARCCAIAA